MQDMSPTTSLVPERKKSEEELLLDLFAEIAMRAWGSARGKTPLTHRLLETICKMVQSRVAETESQQRTAVALYDGADVDAVRPCRAHLLSCHNALWRRIRAHAASTRVSKMKPDGYVLNLKKLPSATALREKHGAMYAAFRDAAKFLSS
ncbi:MAG: hypothetical protein KBE09_04410 [Candidatus Pacebacteria bacterium]|nr:hypothetical protein [Candidatus Paceibacterota bacterium]